MAEKAMVVHNGRKRLTVLLAGAPIVLLCVPMVAVGLVLLVFSGGDIGFHFMGAVSAAAGAVVAWVYWQWIRLDPMGMTVSAREIRLLQKGQVVAAIAKRDIGCVVRCDSVLCIFDRDDRMVGRWGLQWVGVVSHGRFIKAMRRFDYPCRMWGSVRAGRGGTPTIVETHRFGSVARDPDLAPVGAFARVGITDGPHLEGPGLTDGPVAEFFGLVDNGAES